MTVLSTLPSAGVGAVLALLLLRMEFSIIALIGVFLLIGIVKKNAILIIDFALEAERSRGLTPTAAVREACLLRFRPILMTTLAAGLGALPLAIGFGEGSELRQPLGVAIIGGLIASQLLTLLTTPVVYVLLDKLRRRRPDERHLSRAAAAHALNADRSHASTSGMSAPPRAACRDRWHCRAPARRWSAAVGPRLRASADRQRPLSFKEAPATPGWSAAAPGRCTRPRGPWWQLFGDARAERACCRRWRCRTRTSPPRSRATRRRRRWCRGSSAQLWPSVQLTGSAIASGGGGVAGAHHRPGHAVARRGRRELGARSVGPPAAPACRRRRPARRRARPTSPAPRCRRRLRWPPRTSTCARPTPSCSCCATPWPVYERSLQITHNRYAAGQAARTDVLQAETQLANTRADLAALATQRQQFEHAIAVLLGKAPADFALAPAPWTTTVPDGAAGAAVGAAAAPPRHRVGRARGGGGQRADRHRARGLLPELLAERLGRRRRHPHRRPVQRVEHDLVARACRWRRSCSTAARSNAALKNAEASRDVTDRQLSPDRADGVPVGRRPAGAAARPQRAAGAAPAGVDRRRPDRAAGAQPLPRRAGRATPTS